jgi:hypothetical protein
MIKFTALSTRMSPETEVNSSYADEHLSGLFGIDFGKALLKLFDKHLDQLEICKLKLIMIGLRI